MFLQKSRPSTEVQKRDLLLRGLTSCIYITYTYKHTHIRTYINIHNIWYSCFWCFLQCAVFIIPLFNLCSIGYAALIFILFNCCHFNANYPLVGLIKGYLIFYYSSYYGGIFSVINEIVHFYQHVAVYIAVLILLLWMNTLTKLNATIQFLFYNYILQSKYDTYFFSLISLFFFLSVNRWSRSPCVWHWLLLCESRLCWRRLPQSKLEVIETFCVHTKWNQVTSSAF